MQRQLLAAFMLLASVDFSVLARHTLPNANISRIIDGSDVPPGEYVPYQVSVQVCKQHLCGGSIISPSHVLTAGHCCEIILPMEIPLSVLAGVRELDDSRGVSVAVNTYNIHEQYQRYQNNTKINDICILHLERDLPLDGVRFATIAFSASEDVGSDVPVTLTGWGDIDKYETHPNTLQRLTTHTTTNEDCKKNHGLLLETQICVKSRLGSACPGDSGNPLVMSTPQGLRLVGIVSDVVDCAKYTHDAYNVYTKVSKFDAWIRKHMK